MLVSNYTSHTEKRMDEPIAWCTASDQQPEAIMLALPSFIDRTHGYFDFALNSYGLSALLFLEHTLLMAMTKTERLNALFTEWKAQRPKEAARMCLDGIVCEERYENTNPKILFIMKEPNHPLTLM